MLCLGNWLHAPLRKKCGEVLIFSIFHPTRLFRPTQLLIWMNLPPYTIIPHCTAIRHFTVCSTFTSVLGNLLASVSHSGWLIVRLLSVVPVSNDSLVVVCSVGVAVGLVVVAVVVVDVVVVTVAAVVVVFGSVIPTFCAVISTPAKKILQEPRL